MGKRELLLVVGFLVAGVIVYQATAPPPEPGSRGVSISRIIDHIRREIRGTRASAEVTRSVTYPIGSTVSEVRIGGGFGEISIAGEAREDVALDMRIVSNGADEAEARKWAAASEVTVDTTATGITFRAKYPEEGHQRGYFTLKVPARMTLRMDQASNRATITNLAAVEMVTARGETTIKQVPGRVSLAHIGGRLIVEDVGALKLNGRRSDATLTKIRGDLTLDLQNSEVVATAVTGPIVVEARSSELTLTKLEDARGPVRVNAVGGSVALRGVTTEVRIDARDTEVDVELSKAAPVTIYNEGDESIDVTPAAAGYTLDSLALNGRISVPEGTIEVTEGQNEQRANGAVQGGGPAITLRANRGNINVRSKE